MRRLTILTATVLAVCIVFCVASLMALNGILDEAHALVTEVYTLMEEGHRTITREKLVELATLWDERTPLLELLCSHDDLHEVKEHIIQAKICLEYKDPEEFYSAVALVGEAVEHIRDEEALTLSNLY